MKDPLQIGEVKHVGLPTITPSPSLSPRVQAASISHSPQLHITEAKFQVSITNKEVVTCLSPTARAETLP